MSATSSPLLLQSAPQRSIEPGSEKRLVRHGLAVGLENYEFESLLGHDSTCDVYLARRSQVENSGKKTVSRCTVKVVKRSLVGVSCKEVTKNEAEISKKLREAGLLKVVQLEATFCDAFNRYIVTEFIPGGTLASAVRGAGGSLNPTHTRCITAELVYALLFLKDQGIVHRNIKPENILLTERGRAVLSDFGIAVDFTARDSQTVREACGMPGYTAPEVLGGLPYSFEADAFSLGCTIYFCYSGESPFRGNSYGECERRTLTQDVGFSDELGWCFYSKQFVSRLLEKIAILRLTLEDAIDTEYLEGIEWDRVEKGDYDLPVEWLPAPGVASTVKTLDKEKVLVDKNRSFLPWSMDADERAYITPLRPSTGKREQQEGGPARSALERLDRDVRGLFEIPDDEIQIPIQLGVWGFGNATPDYPAWTPSLVESSPPESMFASDDGQDVQTAGDFVPQLAPGPHGGILVHFTEEQARLCERFLTEAGGIWKRSSGGLGPADVPGLATTVPTRPLLQRPPSNPWFSTIQEREFKASQLPIRMRMRLCVSDFKRAVKRMLRMHVEED